MQRKERENCNRAATPGVNSGLVSERLVAEGSWVKTLYIEPGSRWENGYVESFNGKLRDELLNVEIFATLFEVQVLIENWRKDYNQIRPHRALGYRPPAPEAILPDYGSTSLTLSVVQSLGAGQNRKRLQAHLNFWNKEIIHIFKKLAGQYWKQRKLTLVGAKV